MHNTETVWPFCPPWTPHLNGFTKRSHWKADHSNKWFNDCFFLTGHLIVWYTLSPRHSQLFSTIFFPNLYFLSLSLSLLLPIYYHCLCICSHLCLYEFHWAFFLHLCTTFNLSIILSLSLSLLFPNVLRLDPRRTFERSLSSVVKKDCSKPCWRNWCEYHSNLRCYVVTSSP